MIPFRKQIIILLFLTGITRLHASVIISSDSTHHKPSKNFVVYSPGLYTPVGVMTGKLWQKGNGFYFCGRFNFQIFRKANYHFDGSSVDDHSLNWYYTGEKKYSRWELNAGGIIHLLKIKNNAAIKFFAGIGIEKPRYLYSFSNSSRFGNTNSWVEYRELGHVNLNTEAGMLMWINESLNIQIGVSTIQKKHERMITFGIGIGEL